MAAIMTAADAAADAAERKEAEGENADSADSDEGIYEFPDAKNPGKIYVGQSKDVSERLEQWRRQGRLAPGTVPTIRPVPGGRTSREVEEQRRINELGGTRAVPDSRTSNIRNPIGPGRQSDIERKYGPLKQ
jgi:hypothetical protein